MDQERLTTVSATAVMVRGLFRIKPLDAILADAERPEYQLRRVLGPLQLTLLGIGAIIGAGIFATIGTAAALMVPARALGIERDVPDDHAAGLASVAARPTRCGRGRCEDESDPGRGPPASDRHLRAARDRTSVKFLSAARAAHHLDSPTLARYTRDTCLRERLLG